MQPFATARGLDETMDDSHLCSPPIQPFDMDCPRIIQPRTGAARFEAESHSATTPSHYFVAWGSPRLSVSHIQGINAHLPLKKSTGASAEG